MISIHSLRVEGDLHQGDQGRPGAISIHSLRVEGDSPASGGTGSGSHFNPLPPCGGRPDNNLLVAVQNLISIHSLRVEGDPVYRVYRKAADCMISIHSLRVEGDQIHSCANFINFYFNPLPPCGGRPAPDKMPAVQCAFQSTPSVWRETVNRIRFIRYRIDFNPLPPCGGRPLYILTCHLLLTISIHSLRVEGDRRPDCSNAPRQQ